MTQPVAAAGSTVSETSTTVGHRRLTLGLCLAVCAIDGFSTQMMGYTGRSIAADLRFPLPWLGWLFSISTLGAAVGTLLVGAWSDRFGRVRMMALSCALAAVFIAACVLARDFSALLVLRSIAGFGLGGAIPCLIAMSVSAQPPEWRRTTASMIYAALPGGALVGALGSAKLVSAFGWRGVFVASAVLLGAIALLVVALLREAPPGEGERQVDEKRPIQALFTDGRGPLTLALWGFFLFVGPGLILLGLWMPNLLQLMGSTPAQASLLAACLNVGAVLSSFVVGWLIKRYSILLVFGVMLVIGAASWPVMIAFHQNFPVLLLAVFVAGWTMGGVITGGVALAATSHPMSMQATSIGSAVAVTRVGQVIAPLAIGMLLGAGASPSFTMIVCGTPTIAAFLVLIALNRLSLRSSDGLVTST